MAQTWNISGTLDQITFTEPVLVTDTVVVNEYASGAQNDTDLWAYGAWSEAYGYPREVEYFSDRLIFASTTAQPQTLWLSKTGDYSNFGRSSPIVDDDAIAATLNARSVNAVRDLVPLDSLVMLTSGGEWKTTGGQDDVLTPSTIGFKPQSYYGAAELEALVIGNTGIFLQARGRVVRDIGYQFDTDGYTGNDLTIFSSHLFDGHQIIAWDYQQSPLSIVWAVRDDGVLLALTYLREQEVIAWTPIETDGIVESVCCVAELNQDTPYFVVNRDGVRMIERLTTRDIEDIREAFFVDSGLRFDGRNTGSTTITVTGAGFTVNDDVTVTASGALFAATDVGDWLWFGYDDGAVVRIEITEYTSATVITGRPMVNLPAEWQATATTDWAFARGTFTGATHLAGKTVGGLGDGNVIAPVVVSGAGEITVATPVVYGCLGLPYVSDVETLDVSSTGDTVRTTQKIVKEVGLLIKDSRGWQAGVKFDDLVEVTARQYEAMTESAGLLSGLVQQTVSSAWNANGRVCIRQDQPLPLTILALIPSLVAGSK